jgi:hypothetical protein
MRITLVRAVDSPTRLIAKEYLYRLKFLNEISNECLNIVRAFEFDRFVLKKKRRIALSTSIKKWRRALNLPSLLSLI